MADWSTPVLATAYASVLSILEARDVDALTMLVAAPSNQPTGAFKYVRASDKFQEWSGAAWVDKVLSVAGGGTGGATASAARSGIGLGTMATQDSSAVAISGGTLAGSGSGITALDAANIASGTVSTARLGSGVADATKFLRGDSSWQVISSNLRDQSIVVKTPIRSADFTVDFTSDVEPLSGSHIATLPTVVGRGGKRVSFVNTDGGIWSFTPNGAETILGITGASAFVFDFGIYSSFTLEADANRGCWDIL